MSAEVSVVIPARDAAPYIREAIESVLRQSQPPVELIVVDDGSSDGTATIAASFGDPVRVVERRSGAGNVGASRSLGVRQSRCAVLAFLDADDHWEADWLEVGTAALGADPPPDLLHGGMREFLSPDVTPEAARRLRARPGVLPGYHAGATLVRRETYERIGEFDARHPGAEFTDWLMRARDLGLTERVLGRVTLNRRVHAANTTRSRAVLQDHVFAIKASLDRRRMQGAL